MPVTLSRALRTAAPIAAAALLAACSTMGGDPTPAATARLAPTQGSSVAGTVSFWRDGDAVRVKARVTGLKPGAEHGFHIHEKGDCSAPDGMSAGGHFNPAGQPHGDHAAGPHHAGDMPNLKADASGTAVADVTLKGLGIGSGAADIVGKGVIVHANPDDYRTQPTGNAGGRLACGVVMAAG